jgi:serine/threonine protein kinase
MEKPDKSRSILVNEYDHLTKVKGLPGVVQVIDFVSQEHQGNPNFIVMDLLGESVANFRHGLGTSFSKELAFDLLNQMLDSIRTIHIAGLVHRDIKEVRFLL